MHKPKDVFNYLKNEGIDFFTGVPDSLLKEFCAYVTDNTRPDEHIIAANEGNAVALATGHYLGTGKPALVYMQNSGIGNAVNPLTSLADKDVYSIPMLLMIGWRGRPGVKDEPQHVKQGRIMTSMLDSLEIPWLEIKANTPNLEETIKLAVDTAYREKVPVVLLISKGAFEKHSFSETDQTRYSLKREAAIDVIVDTLQPEDLVVSTTGMASRELYEIREKRKAGHSNDFLTVGSMGHAGSIALGLALSQPKRRVFCIDGDGSILMHMGALGVIGNSYASNLIHVVINNGAHDSVGGQPTICFDINLIDIAKSCGYKVRKSIDNKESLMQCFRNLIPEDAPQFIEVKVTKGARSDLGRPKSSPTENKQALMTLVGLDNG